MTAPAEVQVEIGGQSYRVGRLSTFDQFNLASDFRDALSGLAFLRRDRPKDVDDAAYAKTVEYIVTGGAAFLNPERRQRVVDLCLKVVKRKSGVGWTPVTNDAGGMQFKDLDLAAMVALLYRVVEHNGLLDFFSEGPPSSGGPRADESGPGSQPEKTG